MILTHNMKNTFTRKNLFFIFLTLASLLSGCVTLLTQSTPYVAPRLYPIPTPPHEREVEIYLPGQTPRDNDFVKVQIINATFNPNGSYAAVMDELQEKAQKAGLDGLLIQKHTSTHVYDTLNPELSIMVPGQVSALGFRYMTHMGHLFSVPSQSTLVRFDPATSQEDTIWMEKYDLYGRILEESNWDIPFGKFHKNLLPHYWLGAKDDHQGEWRYANNTNGQVLNRHYYVNNTYQKRARFTYNKDFKLQKIKVQSQAEGNYQMNFAYVGQLMYDSTQRRIAEMHIQKWESTPATKRYLERDSYIDWEIHMNYREDGEMKEIMYLEKYDGKKYPRYKLIYTYFNEDQIRAHVKDINAYPKFR